MGIEKLLCILLFLFSFELFSLWFVVALFERFVWISPTGDDWKHGEDVSPTWGVQVVAAAETAIGVRLRLRLRLWHHNIIGIVFAVALCAMAWHFIQSRCKKKLFASCPRSFYSLLLCQPVVPSSVGSIVRMERFALQFCLVIGALILIYALGNRNCCSGPCEGYCWVCLVAVLKKISWWGSVKLNLKKTGKDYDVCNKYFTLFILITSFLMIFWFIFVIALYVNDLL